MAGNSRRWTRASQALLRMRRRFAARDSGGEMPEGVQEHFICEAMRRLIHQSLDSVQVIKWILWRWSIQRDLLSLFLIVVLFLRLHPNSTESPRPVYRWLSSSSTPPLPPALSRDIRTQLESTPGFAIPTSTTDETLTLLPRRCAPLHFSNPLRWTTEKQKMSSPALHRQWDEWSIYIVCSNGTAMWTRRIRIEKRNQVVIETARKYIFFNYPLTLFNLFLYSSILPPENWNEEATDARSLSVTYIPVGVFSRTNLTAAISIIMLRAAAETEKEIYILDVNWNATRTMDTGIVFCEMTFIIGRG